MAGLRGRVALVTGGGWNLGRAVAERLAEAGAHVAVASRDTDRLSDTARALRQSGAEALAVPMDATCAGEVEAGVAFIRKKLGPIDMLAAFAGGGAEPGRLDEGDADQWWKVVETNLRTAQLAARATLPDLRASENGTMLFCVGAGAFFPEPSTPISAYAVAQAALCRLTDQLAVDEMESGVRVNALEPGAVGVPGDKDHSMRLVRAAELAMWLLSKESAPLTGRIVSATEDWWRDPEAVERVAQSHHLACLRRVDPTQAPPAT